MTRSVQANRENVIGVEGARSRFAVGRHWDERAERKGLCRYPVG